MLNPLTVAYLSFKDKQRVLKAAKSTKKIPIAKYRYLATINN